jgi:hypothetical protein
LIHVLRFVGAAGTITPPSAQPTNVSQRAVDEDGVACSSGHYLRITGDGGRMIKGQLALTAVRPTKPVVGGDTPVNLAAGRPVAASSTSGPFVPANAVDGDPNSAWESVARLSTVVDGDPSSYWESASNGFPQWVHRHRRGASAAYAFESGDQEYRLRRLPDSDHPVCPDQRDQRYRQAGRTSSVNWRCTPDRPGYRFGSPFLTDCLPCTVAPQLASRR